MTISDLEGIETMNTATPAAAPVPADHPAGRRLTYAQAPLGRLASTGLAFAYMLLAIPALALFIIEVTFIPLVIITVGALALPLVVPVVAALATLHRRMASRVLGEPVLPFYKSTEGLGWLGRLQRWAGDPARWRDLVWLILSATVGFTLGLIGVVLFLAIFWYLLFPFLFAITPDGVFDMQLGFMTIDTVAESFLVWIGALVFFGLWWFTIKPIVRAIAFMDRAMLSSRTERLEARVSELSTSRADTVDQSAAEIRRIERDLHDGAQARLVALGMSLGMADELMARDPEAARKMLAEARLTTTAALGDLRSVVRGIHPPVLADRGLAGAVQALAMEHADPGDDDGDTRLAPAGSRRVGRLLRGRGVSRQHRQARAGHPRLDHRRATRAGAARGGRRRRAWRGRPGGRDRSAGRRTPAVRLRRDAGAVQPRGRADRGHRRHPARLPRLTLAFASVPSRIARYRGKSR